MFENVVVGVDFRQGGRDAIALAGQLSDEATSTTLAHVCAGRFTRSHAIGPGLVAEECERARDQLEEERTGAGVRAELVVTQRPTQGQGLHELAEERGADLLVLGSCHRGAFGRAMLGDHTRASIDGAPCAVAIAPAGYAESPRPLATIGVAYDGSPESHAALEAARELAGAHHSKIRALQIVTLAYYPYAAPGSLVAQISESVKEANAAMKALEGVDGHAEYGLPGSDLAVFSETVDLLVCGSRGYGPWGRLVHGSTSSQLAHHTRSPLLIVPRPGAPGGSAEQAAGEHAAISAPAE